MLTKCIGRFFDIVIRAATSQNWVSNNQVKLQVNLSYSLTPHCLYNHVRCTYHRSINSLQIMTSYSLVTVTPEDRPRGDRYLCDYFPENLEVSGYSSQVFQLESFFVRFSAWRRSLSRCAGCCSLDHSDQRFVDYCLSPDTALYSQSSRTRRGVLGTLVWVRDQT